MTFKVETEHSTYTIVEVPGEEHWSLTSTNPRYAGPIKVNMPPEARQGIEEGIIFRDRMVLPILPDQGYKGYLFTSPVIDVEVTV